MKLTVEFETENDNETVDVTRALAYCEIVGHHGQTARIRKVYEYGINEAVPQLEKILDAGRARYEAERDAKCAAVLTERELVAEVVEGGES